jgi:hypothetical protein
MALVGAILAAWCAVAAGQSLRVRGTIERVDGNVLLVRSSEGAELELTLVENATIVAVAKASMADIREGTYLGSAAIPQSDGSQKALEVHIFPEQMRGAGEGHRPYAPVPESTMTNGSTSGSMVAGVDGSSIVVKYKEGEKKIVVVPETVIVTYVPGDKSELKPGAKIFIGGANKKDDGTLEASAVSVGRDGITPPM